jgi:hypothetical protein
VKLLYYRHVIVGETYFMGEELNEVLQNSNNEEYKENKHSEGCNVEIDKEVDEIEENGRKQELPPLHVHSIRLFHISLE